MVEFYSVQLKKKIVVPHEKVKYRLTKNGRKMAYAELDVNGKVIKVAKFVKK